MATTNLIKNQMQTQNSGAVNANQLNLKGLLNTNQMKQKFNDVLQDKAPGFTTSLLNLVSNDRNLSKCEPMSVATSAMVAATLDLPIDKNLGYAWIIPYGNKATFQLGYKGYIQLAQRSGQYLSLNVIEVYEGELKSWNRLTEEFEFDSNGRTSNEVIGYVGYFKLVNGFEKTVYWTKQEIEAHRRRFSKSGSVWKSDFDAMAKKTVLRNMLSKWGVLSIEMQTATTKDGTVQEIDEETKELKTAEVIEDESDPNDVTYVNDDGEVQLFNDMQPPMKEVKADDK
ncbi:recombinase RecT [Pisciglobus halotolerans]|uniref:Recombination protein RecT n=1 Tax=Pisciglobus halotolerans TaxID=745365 RepID=A0A1I3BIP5_9LACT|nr:recombinase RecT [Pisciglobus halotolerans]SFH62175.1 recombination protein RecT [Pisciglobus halotolerans]